MLRPPNVHASASPIAVSPEEENSTSRHAEGAYGVTVYTSASRVSLPSPGWKLTFTL